MVRILGGPLRLNVRAAHNIFSGWILPSRYDRPLMLKKPLQFFFSSKNHSVAIKVSETTWHLFGIFFRCCIFRQIFFPIWDLSVRSDEQVHFKKLFVSVVITSCKSMAVSVSGAELVFGGNLLCNVLMACYSLGAFYIWTKSQSLYK